MRITEIFTLGRDSRDHDHRHSYGDDWHNRDYDNWQWRHDDWDDRNHDNWGNC